VTLCGVGITLTTWSLFSGHVQRENDEKSERITILESQMDALLKAKDEVSGDTRIYLCIVNEYICKDTHNEGCGRPLQVASVWSWGQA
jgi:hypothetical protein